MTLEQLWRAITLYWRSIILCSLVVAVGTGLGSYFLLSPLDQSTVLLDTAIALPIGLLLGVLLAFLRVTFNADRRLQAFFATEMQWPLLATLLFPWKAKRLAAYSMLRHDDEGYRRLRARIGFLSNERTLRTLVMTTAREDEDVGRVAANLALLMARSGKRVLLVDANIRQPDAQQYFAIPTDAQGLSEAIQSLQTATPTSVADLLSEETPEPHGGELSPHILLEAFTQDVDVPGLWVMPAGIPSLNPTELLDSPALQKLLQVLLRTRFEVILFIAPPLLHFSDASILASKVDGTMLVVKRTRANKEDLRQVKTLLQDAAASVAGYILLKKQHQSTTQKGAAHGKYAAAPVDELAARKLGQPPDAKMSLFVFKPTISENTVKIPAIDVTKERRPDNGQ